MCTVSDTLEELVSVPVCVEVLEQLLIKVLAGDSGLQLDFMALA